MTRITIGITTHNEAEHIGDLLDALMRADEQTPIIMYDDCSSDDTAAVVERHPIARRKSFSLAVAEKNHGGPAIGRQFIADNATTEYVTLVDGDDIIDVPLLYRVMQRVDVHADMIITPYNLRGREQHMKAPPGPVEITSETITRLISGIGGRIYSRDVLAQSICREFLGRSEDARLNMKALLNGFSNIVHVPNLCFYYIKTSRKSLSAKQIRVDEIEWRLRAYSALQEIYPIDNGYLYAVKRNLLTTIDNDALISAKQRSSLKGQIRNLIPNKALRVVFLANDLSLLGGVPARINRALEMSGKRGVDYEAISRLNSGGVVLPNHFSCADGVERVLHRCEAWRQHDTVVIAQNNILLHFPSEVQKTIKKFPIIYFGDAQLSFMIQNVDTMANRHFSNWFRVSKIISLSEKDIEFQRQLGIHGQVKGFLPVEQKVQNNYKVKKPLTIGYVGVSDFRAKATDRLVDLSLAMREAELPPLKIYTTNSRNSPHYDQLIVMLSEAGASEHCEITLGCSDKNVLFSELSFLVVPSKQESFGNVILEAFSYGVPVIACSYAPGPSELIRHGYNGFLLDEFSGAAVVDLLAALTPEMLRRLSDQAFESHKRFTDERYFEFLEGVADEVVNNFRGENTLRVFPELAAVNSLSEKLKKKETAVEEMRALVASRGAPVQSKDKPGDKRQASRPGGVTTRTDPHEGNDTLTRKFQEKIEVIRASGLLDEKWYRTHYLDVGLLGIDPALHYLKYGAHLARDPSAEFSTGFYYDVHPDVARNGHNPILHYMREMQKTGNPPEPDRRNILWAASRLATRDATRALALAERLLPADLTHTLEILRANAVLADETAWLTHLNNYLSGFAVAPLRMKAEGPTRFHRLSCDPLPFIESGPLISVIMPAWNAEKTIATAARSILDQTWRPLELIIVDDASTDGTWTEMQTLAAADDRIKILQNRRNVGPYVSKNLALSYATGDYVTGHDADDWAHPQRIQNHLMAVFSSGTPVPVSVASMLRMSIDGEILARKISTFSPDGFLQRATISTLFDINVLRNLLGSWECVRFGADSEMLKRAEVALAKPVPHFQQIGMVCQNLESSLTNNSFFGIDKDKGMSGPRRQYQSYWKLRHSKISSSSAYLAFPPQDKIAEAPDSATVPIEYINENLKLDDLRPREKLRMSI